MTTPLLSSTLSSLLQPRSSLDYRVVFCLALVQTVAWYGLFTMGSRPMRKKRAQTWWQLGGYAIMFILGAYRMHAENLNDIFFRLQDVWSNPPLTARLSVFYFEFEIAWYLSSLICCLINRDTKDWYAMMIHHIITPAEIWYSYECGYSAIGMVIMFLHDCSDVFLHLAKALYNEKFTSLTDATFTLFATVFFFTRLILLPLCPYSYFYMNPLPHNMCGDVLSYTCAVLVGLHCYWFSIIVSMIIKFAKEGNVNGDARDEEEQEQLQEFHAKSSAINDSNHTMELTHELTNTLNQQANTIMVNKQTQSNGRKKH